MLLPPAMALRAIGACFLLLIFSASVYAQRTNPAFLVSPTQTAESVFDNGGAPWPFLAQINAENYDNGGPNIAFQQPNIGQPNCLAVPPGGQAYRPTDFVDLYASIDGVAWQVGCNLPFDYYKYQINIPASPGGPYELRIRVANPSPNAGQSTWTALIDNVSVGSVTGQQTANLNTFADLFIGAPSGFNATAGQHTLELIAGGVAAGTPAGEISWFEAFPVGQTITSISPNAATVPGAPCADGTLVTALTATMSSAPPFNGTWAASGDTNFRLGGSGPTGTTLVCNGSVPSGTYAPIVTATQPGLAPKSQAITVTVRGTVSGVCGQGTFSNSSCPPLPAGTTQWVYLGGSEFTTVPDYVNDPQWAAGTPKEGTLSSGIGCTINNGHVSADSNGLVLTGATPAECQAAGGDTPSCAARGGSTCVGPTLDFCLVPSDQTTHYCGLLTQPGGVYMEWRMWDEQSPFYWAVWQDSIFGTSPCPPDIYNGGLEVDTVEAFGSTGGGHFLYGNYATCIVLDSSYNNPTDWSTGFHNVGTEYLVGDGVSFFVDGTNLHKFTTGVPASVGVLINFLWATPEHPGGKTHFRWLRIYRAE